MATRLKQPEIILPAIRANAGVEAAYRKQLQLLARQMARSMLLHIKAAYRQTDPAVGFAQDRDPISYLRAAMAKWGARWTRKINKASRDISRMFADRVRGDFDRRMMTMLKQAGFAVEFKPTDAMVQAYKLTVESNVNLIKSIPAQFLKDVQTDVWQAVMKGSDIGGLTKALQKHYGVTYRRAAFIARDQNAKARAVMEEARRAEIGITEAIWLHSGGGKEPRPEHVRWGTQRKRYKIKQGMWSSVDRAYVWPGTAINCRCVSRSVFPGSP